MTIEHNSYPVAPNSVYVWRGFKSSSMSYDQFVNFLGNVFVPACGLLQPSVGLRAYLPVMVPQINKSDAVPDQTALMFWATPASHNLAEKAIAVRIYQNLHGDVYDMEKSKLPEIPISIVAASGTLDAEQPYFLLDQHADWMFGDTCHFIGHRHDDVEPAVFLKTAYDWAMAFHNKTPADVDGALLCCGNDYVAAWIHYTKEHLDTTSLFTALSNVSKIILDQNLSSIRLPAGLWNDWKGLNLEKTPCINIQFPRPPASDTIPKKV